MKHFPLTRIAFLSLIVAVLAIGCDRSVPPPSALPIEQLPAAFEKAFGKAKPEIKDLAQQIVSLVQGQDYAKAFFELQSLSSKPSLTKEQVSVTARGSLTVSSLLQAAQAKGDTKAAEAVKLYHDTK